MKVTKLFSILAVSAALLVAACGCTESGTTENPNDFPANALEKEGYNLVFSDEFDEKKIDTKKWLPQYFPHSTTIASACQTTYRIEDGKLCLYIDENTGNFSESTEMKVSSIQTIEKNNLHPNTANVTNVVPYESFACQYGYFEMRAKMPSCGGGGHVAWWLIGTQDDARADGTMSSQNGEIDIVETSFEYTNVFNPKVHAWDDKDLYAFEKATGLEGTYDDSYHIYAMDWTPSGLTFYVDGVEICSTTNSPQYRMGMFLGIYTDCVSFTGAANDVYPKEFWVDYIRVYQKEGGYPDGVTKDTTPVVLPQDFATQYDSKMLGNTEITQTQPNLLFSANALLNDGTDIAGLCDGDYKYGYVSPDGVELPDTYTFTWDTPITADTLRIACNCAVGQAPTYMEIQAQGEDGQWKTINDFNVNWITITDVAEYVDIPVELNEVTAMRLIVKDANLEWGHYVISEMKLFLASDTIGDDAQQVQSVIPQDTDLRDDNFAPEAERVQCSGSGVGVDELVNESHKEGYVSEDNPALPQDIEFTFAQEQTICGVRMTGNCALGQAPVLVEISVKINGEYKSVGMYRLKWQSKSVGNEYCDMEFESQSGVEAVKVTILQANLEWNHYSIQEIQMY